MLRVELFKWVLRLSTPAHKYFGLTYDAAISKELIPVIFSREGAKVALPELEIIEPGQINAAHSIWPQDLPDRRES